MSGHQSDDISMIKQNTVTIKFRNFLSLTNSALLLPLKHHMTVTNGFPQVHRMLRHILLEFHL